MIYDRVLTVCVPPQDWGKPADGPLQSAGHRYYAEITLFHRRYWEALQAGSRVDRMVQIPMGYDVLPASYVVLEDRHVYRIEEAQYTRDADNLPVTNLTLRRMEANYDLCKPAGCA